VTQPAGPSGTGGHAQMVEQTVCRTTPSFKSFAGSGPEQSRRSQPCRFATCGDLKTHYVIDGEYYVQKYARLLIRRIGTAS